MTESYPDGFPDQLKGAILTPFGWVLPDEKNSSPDSQPEPTKTKRAWAAKDLAARIKTPRQANTRISHLHTLLKSQHAKKQKAEIMIKKYHKEINLLKEKFNLS